MELEFFMPMIPPTATAQEKRARAAKGKPVFYDPPEVKAARAKLTACLARRRPEKPLEGAVHLAVKWCFPRGRHADGEYRTSRPDTDNLQKLLKDCMTAAGFWRDDAQVAAEICEKFWAETPGIYVSVGDCAEDFHIVGGAVEIDFERPPCYRAETDDPYPLCAGRGFANCAHCCLWTDYDPDEDESRVNRPLTLDELRRMDGEPVWIELRMDVYPAVWGIVNAADGAVWDIQAHLPQRLAFGRYGKTWLAYRRKKEEARP